MSSIVIIADFPLHARGRASPEREAAHAVVLGATATREGEFRPGPAR